MAKILFTISTVSFALAAVFLAIAVFLWFKFEILGIISDLSGRTAKKSIAKIRENNEKTGKKSFRPSSVNLDRGKLTDTMKDSEKLDKKAPPKTEKQPETGLLSENQGYISTKNITELLDDNSTTCLLNEKEIESLDSNGTTVLNNNVVNNFMKVAGAVEFTILDEVMLIHTDEVI